MTNNSNGTTTALEMFLCCSCTYWEVSHTWTNLIIDFHPTMDWGVPFQLLGLEFLSKMCCNHVHFQSCPCMDLRTTLLVVLLQIHLLDGLLTLKLYFPSCIPPVDQTPWTDTGPDLSPDLVTCPVISTGQPVWSNAVGEDTGQCRHNTASGGVTCGSQLIPFREQACYCCSLTCTSLPLLLHLGLVRALEGLFHVHWCFDASLVSVLKWVPFQHRIAILRSCFFR